MGSKHHAIYYIKYSTSYGFPALIQFLHVKIIAYQRIINHSFWIFYTGRNDCSFYNKQKNTWMLGNSRFISRVEHDIMLLMLEINPVFPRTHVSFSTVYKTFIRSRDAKRQRGSVSIKAVQFSRVSIVLICTCCTYFNHDY